MDEAWDFCIDPEEHLTTDSCNLASLKNLPALNNTKYTRNHVVTYTNSVKSNVFSVVFSCIFITLWLFIQLTPIYFLAFRSISMASERNPTSVLLKESSNFYHPVG